ncbi:MAG TPA: late promoter transcription accessory protein, partial [Methanosarcina sp.]|nr:late promoter transcription accessory protein [Methanosarcina sp.]
MFENPIEFSSFVEKSASEKGMGLLEFLAQYVEENSIEEETIPPLLTPILKSKIEEEARKQYSMPKRTYNQLDI